MIERFKGKSMKKPALLEQWMLSKETVTVIVDYDDPKWRTIPKQEGKYSYVSTRLCPDDFPVRKDSGRPRTGKWLITFQWLTQHGGFTTEQGFDAVAICGLPGATRAEIETVINAYPQHGWVGFGKSRFRGYILCIYQCVSSRRRRLGFGNRDAFWAESDRLLLVSKASPF